MEPRAPLYSILEITTLALPIAAGFAPPDTAFESPLLLFDHIPDNDPKDLFVQAFSDSYKLGPGHLSSLSPTVSALLSVPLVPLIVPLST